MGPRRPELEYAPLTSLRRRKQHLIDCGDLPPRKDVPLSKVLGAVQKYANSSLKRGPFTVTDTEYVAPSGDKRDFLSWAPYWWPEEMTVAGKKEKIIVYVKRDENFLYLALGYFFLEDERYAKKAAELLRVWFVDSETRMNPNVNYGQIIRGEGKGHGVGRKDGILSTRNLARIANLFSLVKTSPNMPDNVAAGVIGWFTAYMEWLQSSTGSSLAQRCARSNNNHESWYHVQLCSILIALDRHDEARAHLMRFFNETWCGKQCDKDGTCDQPLESERTRPFHYIVFNLQAIFYLLGCAEELGIADEIWSCGDHSIRRAVEFVIQFWHDGTIYTKGKEKKIESNADPTELVGCVLCVIRKYGDPKRIFKPFVKEVKNGDKRDRIEGTKHMLRRLWEIDG